MDIFSGCSMLDGKQPYDPEFVKFLLFDGVIPVLAGDFSRTYQQGLWIWTRPTKMSECIFSRLLEYMSFQTVTILCQIDFRQARCQNTCLIKCRNACQNICLSSRMSKLNKMFIYVSESLSDGMPNEMSLRMSDKILT